MCPTETCSVRWKDRRSKWKKYHSADLSHSENLQENSRFHSPDLDPEPKHCLLGIRENPSLSPSSVEVLGVKPELCTGMK